MRGERENSYSRFLTDEQNTALLTYISGRAEYELGFNLQEKGIPLDRLAVRLMHLFGQYKNRIPDGTKLEIAPLPSVSWPATKGDTSGIAYVYGDSGELEKQVTIQVMPDGIDNARAQSSAMEILGSLKAIYGFGDASEKWPPFSINGVLYRGSFTDEGK